MSGLSQEVPNRRIHVGILDHRRVRFAPHQKNHQKVKSSDRRAHVTPILHGPYTPAPRSGRTHTLATTNSQNAGAGTRYVWTSWSDGGAISHLVSPTLGTNLTANFTTQYYLTLNAGIGGDVVPVSLWKNSGAAVRINDTHSNAFSFDG